MLLVLCLRKDISIKIKFKTENEYKNGAKKTSTSTLTNKLFANNCNHGTMQNY